MQHHYAIAFNKVGEVDIVLVVKGHVIVAGDEKVEENRSDSP